MTPNEYTRAVCACLRHATPKEKQAVAQELQDHLADHADALAEAPEGKRRRDCAD